MKEFMIKHPIITFVLAYTVISKTTNTVVAVSKNLSEAINTRNKNINVTFDVPHNSDLKEDEEKENEEPKEKVE